ncbi:hypothetical protein [Pontibacter cellulosilyticus]|uniref:Uncharacterized protein n=1 Tax=Pontibacter cellulosilyticus TaxID=1720253 RepID=A0A923N603_9BACT|nr:hypothetical protein [Pontibacter cellulosilyticus]MBC5993253.1 hypothetical protein [Pontibacter cellulosilyticus]
MNIRLGHLILIALALLFTGCVRKNFYAKTPLVNPEVRQKLEQNPQSVDSVVVQAGRHYKRGFLHRIFWGKHYRPVWAAPAKVPVFDMDTTKGGLEIEKLGGGYQTTSLTLKDKNGFTYALRSVDKDPELVLPKVWRNTFVLNILRDQISAINPYGALALPPMAKAAGIPHSSPELVYVRPNDSSFGEYEDKFSDKLFTIEEKYNDKRALTPELGDAIDIVNSSEVLNKRYEEDNHFIDQLAFAKARLFDILIHDWDRHEGQWEWAEYENKKNHIYRPIPKDRDNVFYRFQDGTIPWIFSRNWAIRKFESFDDEYNDIYALMINSKFLDERALSQVTRAQFDSLAKELQTSITDDVIARGVQNFPDSVYSLVGESTQRKLINRRNKLHEAADKAYEILAKEVLVVGTDLEDEFEVNRLDDEKTEVIVKRKSDDNVIYRRTFYRSETDLITLHGLAEDDEFKISGKVNEGIKIEIYGGRGEDEIKDESEVKRGGKKTWVYDTKRGTELEAGPTTKDKRKNDVRLHAFDREGF